MTYSITVCPHDTAQNLPAWFFLNNYLQHHTGMGLHMQTFDDFEAQRKAVLDGEVKVVYANPFDAALYARELGFVPIARRATCCDEALIVAAADSPWTTIADAMGQACKLASATEKTAVHALGVALLKEQGACREDFDIQFKGNYVSVIKALTKGEADLGILFNETYDGLSELAKSQIKVLAASTSGQTFHLFCASPELGEQVEGLKEVLSSMSNEAEGQRCLDDLGFAGFEPVDAASFSTLVEACETRW